MAIIVKDATVTWNWSGDDSSITGYSIVVTMGENPNTEAVSALNVISVGSAAKSYTFHNASLEVGASYTVWVRANYVGKSSDWVASSVVNITADANANILNSDVTAFDVGLGSVTDGADITADAISSVPTSSFPSNVQNANTTLSDVGAGLMAGLDEINSSNFTTYIKYINAESITAGIVTGIMVRTASSGTRAEMHSTITGSKYHAFGTYNSSGTLQAYMDANGTIHANSSISTNGTISAGGGGFDVNSSGSITDCTSISGCGSISCASLSTGGGSITGGAISGSSLSTTGNISAGTLTLNAATETGSATSNFVSTNKPGSTSSNVWQKIAINGSFYYIAVWS